MKKIISLSLFAAVFACTNKTYMSNGETIYRTGRNSSGKILLDNHQSSFTLIKSCQGCHGPKGNRMKNKNIQFSRLSDPALYETPYSDSLLVLFLDQDLKSNGRKADIGVRWVMSDQDKKDLILFLKSL